MKTKLVSVDALKPSAFNPPGRITGKQMERLVGSMRRDGFHPYEPIIVTSKYEVADGHRRLEAAKRAGIKSIPVLIVTGKTAAQLWAELDVYKRKITSTEWGDAWKGGMNFIPTNHCSTALTRIAKIESTLGPDGMKYITEKKLSPMAIDAVFKVCNYLSDTRTEFLWKVLRWMAETKSQRPAINAMLDMIETDVLLKHIEENKPLRLTYSPTK